MSLDDFWNGDPILAKVYRDSHEIRNEIRNQELWMQGLYNYRAFSAVIESLAYGFSGGKGNKPSQYPDKPYALSERERQLDIERNKQRTLDWVKANQ